MNKIHTTSVMLSLSWYLTVSYGGTNPLPWPHGIIIHGLQNLSRSSRSSRYIWYILLTVLWIQWIGLYDSIHILFFTYYIVENNACLDTASVLLLLAHKTKIEFPIPHKKSRFLVGFFYPLKKTSLFFLYIFVLNFVLYHTTNLECQRLEIHLTDRNMFLQHFYWCCNNIVIVISFIRDNGILNIWYMW